MSVCLYLLHHMFVRVHYLCTPFIPSLTFLSENKQMVASMPAAVIQCHPLIAHPQIDWMLGDFLIRLVSALTYPLPPSSSAPSFYSTSGACSWISYLHHPEAWYCYWIQNPLSGPAWILQLLRNVLSLLPVSPLPLSFFSLSPPLLCLTTSPSLLCAPSLPPRRSQWMAIYTESGSARGFCLLKGSLPWQLLLFFNV